MNRRSLLAAALAAVFPAAAAPASAVINAADYGLCLDADGETNTRALQEAITAAQQVGGAVRI